MPPRLGLGPVFLYELLTASRRWQLYALRALFILILLAALSVVWWAQVGGRDPSTNWRQWQAQVGESFYYALVGTQLSLLLLAAPAATAGAVCLDKARGSFLHLLVTDLTDAEIVLGKLAARLLPVLSLVAASLPVMALGTWLGGIEPDALAGAYLVMTGVAVFGCALALALSVWGKKTHEVLLVAYLVCALELLLIFFWSVLDYWLGVGAAPDWLKATNPYWLAFAPYARPGTTDFADCVAFLGGALGLSALLAAGTVWRVRAVVIDQAGRPDRERPPARRWGWPGLARWLPGPSLDANPVLWREWHRRRPSRWMRAVWAVYLVLAVLASASAVAARVTSGATGDMVPFVNAFVATVGLLFVSVSSVTALADERVRGSLDVLLSTPLPTAQIVWGKWCGAYRTVPALAVLPGLVSVLVALLNGCWAEAALIVGLVLAYGAGFTSLGLALATWVPRFGRAVGLSVAAYVFMNAGWLFLASALVRNLSSHEVQGVASGSPWFGIGYTSAVLEQGRRWSTNCAEWALIWIALYFLVTCLLFSATLKTFDRCMGRATLDWRGPRP